MDNMNKTLAVHALVTLALCYLPGVLAAWLQIVRGTKYSRFPSWLDNWLKMRKQLGLLMFFAASIHVRVAKLYNIYLTSLTSRLVCPWPTCPRPTRSWPTESRWWPRST